MELPENILDLFEGKNLLTLEKKIVAGG